MCVKRISISIHKGLYTENLYSAQTQWIPFFYSIQIATHFQSINVAHMSLEVPDFDFVKQTCAPI